MKIYVTGIGIVSAIGLNVDENLLNLRLGNSGIHRSKENGLMLGAVMLSNEAILQKLQLSEDDYSRSTLLGMLALEEAWIGQTLIPEIKTGMVSATSIGGLDRTEKYYFQSDKAEAKRQLMTHDNGRTTEKIARRLGLSGFINTISTACSSGANAIMYGARLISAKMLDRVIVGGVDPFAIYNFKGFSSLNIYDPNICKPFDQERQGLNLGEGAAFLILENENSLRLSGQKPICELAGWGNATDAYHQTASSPEGKGASLAMLEALKKAGIGPEAIGYVNAHGTGTENNDLSESRAFMKVFGENMPPFSSTKGFTGHTLAAAGAIEAVYAVLALREQAYIPGANFQHPMQETGFVPITNYASATSLEYVLSNSFGFGGNCTSLIFKKL